ncbi:hypothetical protein PCE1_000603 [Barthelona sp. PCE]
MFGSFFSNPFENDPFFNPSLRQRHGQQQHQQPTVIEELDENGNVVERTELQPRLSQVQQRRSPFGNSFFSGFSGFFDDDVFSSNFDNLEEGFDNQGATTSYSSCRSTYSNVNGVTQSTRSAYDSNSGVTVSTETRQIGDRAVHRRTIRDNEGNEEKTERFDNINDHERDLFDAEWQNMSFPEWRDRFNNRRNTNRQIME